MSIDNLAAVHKLLLNAFGEQDFDFFCYDHFRDVYKDFNPRMNREDKADALLKYVDSHHQMDHLLALIKEANPAAYESLAAIEAPATPADNAAEALVAQSQTTTPLPTPGNNAVFISYSRRDEDFIRELYNQLTQRGISAWYDRKNIRIGQHWPSEIVQGIGGCQIFLLSLSPDSTASENVRKELDLAQRYKKQIVPLVWRPVKIPVAMEYQLAGIQWIEFNQVASPENFEQLANVLKGMLGGASMQEAASTISIATQSGVPAIVEEAPQSSSGRRKLGGLKQKSSVSPIALGGSVISNVVTTFNLDTADQDFVNEELKWLFSAADNFLKVQRDEIPRTQPVATPIPVDAEKEPSANNCVLGHISDFDLQIWTGQVESTFKRIQIHLRNLDILLEKEATMGDAGKGEVYLQNQIKGGRLEIVKILQELAHVMRQAYGVFVSSPDQLAELLR